MNAVQVVPQSTGLAPGAAGARMNALVPTNIREALELADIMAKASLIPDHLRGKPGDCLLVIMQAQRWGMDAVSVAQCTSVVHGRLCYEGKLVAAAMYAMGALDGRLHYEISGTGQTASIVVTGTPRGGHGAQTVSGTVKDWRTYGKDKQGNRIDNAWDKQPEDQLVYRGTRQWARRYAPEALLGVYTPDEIEDVQGHDTTVVATVVQPSSYPEADFEKNLPKWRHAIANGRTTTDELIAMVSSKGRLSSEQVAKIRAPQQPDRAEHANNPEAAA